MNQIAKTKALEAAKHHAVEACYDEAETDTFLFGATIALDALDQLLPEDEPEAEGNVSAEQLDPLRLMADTLETKLQALRNQQQDHNERSRNYAVLFEAAKQATKLKLLIAAALLNVKNSY